jgi:hypothetical protein
MQRPKILYRHSYRIILPRSVPSLLAAWPAPAVPNEGTLSCAADKLFVACVWLASGAVDPWSVYRLEHGQTQSEFEF